METIIGNQGQQGWLRRWRAFGMTFAVSKGCGIKAKWSKGCSRSTVINGQRKTGLLANAHKKKERLYERQHHCCWLCNKEMRQRDLQIHHILPLYFYPELSGATDNLLLLCDRCHKHIHQNPLLSANLIRETAVKLGVTDLTERFSQAINKD